MINHVAFIMDGNRRWAKAKGLHQFKGHEAGADTLRNVCEFLQKRGIKYGTFYALSVENLTKRSPEEVAFHFGLHKKYIREEILDNERFMKDGIRFNVLGRIDMLPKDEQQIIKEAMEKTKHNSKFFFNVCIAYNGQDEIVDAVRSLINKGVRAEQVTREMIKSNLYTKDIPAPDLIIRTGMNPDQRISAFLLWDSSYAEFAFTKTLWPDFSDQELGKILDEFEQRERREGK